MVDQVVITEAPTTAVVETTDITVVAPKTDIQVVTATQDKVAVVQTDSIDVAIVEKDSAIIVESKDISVVTQGQQGPQGPQGPQGIPGPAGSDLNFLYSQGVPASVWTIAHNLNKYPSVTVIDSAGNSVEGEVQYTGVNTLAVVFTSTFSGTAALN